MVKQLLILLTLIQLSFFTFTQSLPNAKNTTRADTLRGSITKERAWWDLKQYELSVSVNPTKKTISGRNSITYEVISEATLMQIDLQRPLKIKKITQEGKNLKYHREGNVYFVKLKKKQTLGEINQIHITYNGKPREARMAPWDGGFSWKKDELNNDFIATSCQGLGASVWWPCKDHMYDEPDNGMTIHATIPKRLMAVSNGRLVDSLINDKTNTYTWKVVNPINNYGVNLNIGNYVHFGEKYQGEKGELDMEYWVLKQNLNQAKVQFKDAKRMMEAFEHWFGPYPFYEDSYKLVEVPYLGMEHQSSVTYGNGYQNGYLGRDLSGTGWGKKFDFIIIHESGHEWFANNITYKDIADMWLHESFTSYSEALFLEYFYGKKAAAAYIIGKQKTIQNKSPMISNYGINESPTNDIYNKGSSMLHTLRQWLNNDEMWRNLLRNLNSEFYHKTVSSKEVEEYIAQFLGLDLNSFFNQYLRDIRIPTFTYKIENNNQLLYKWTNCNKDFDMPLQVIIDGEKQTLKFNKNQEFNSFKLNSGKHQISVDPNYYVFIEKWK
ncbi:MAG: M1 family peptidase [Bacteroidetes bacterium]|nr:MAG: M1 family peptidase [Bacteroidota bacterium]MBL1144098.1 M1 family peptidase [Bacteroidota bacterium]NOG56893.1 M1 family metallopeptidase [Bacteroidota bacterium]